MTAIDTAPEMPDFFDIICPDRAVVACGLCAHELACVAKISHFKKVRHVIYIR
jgi:hypothetical protein